MSPAKSLRQSACAFCVFSLGFSLPLASADDGTWIGTAGNWGDGVNWADGVIADGVGATAIFGDSSSTQVIHLGGQRRIVGHLKLDGSQWNFQNGSFTLETSSGLPSITTTKGYQYIAVAINGTQGFTKKGTGNLYLAAASTYTGVTTIEEGTLRVRTSNALGATGSGNHTEILSAGSTFGRLVLENNVRIAEDLVFRFTDGARKDVLHTGSGSNSTASGSITLDRAGTDTGRYVFEVLANSGTTLNLTGSVSGRTSGTQATPGQTDANRLLVNAGGQVDISASISDGTIGEGGLSVYKSGSGVLRLSGNNSYTGSTVLTAGVLLVNNTAGSGTGAGAVQADSGTIIGGTGTLAPSGTDDIVFLEGATVSPGDYDDTNISTIGTLTIDLSNTSGTVVFATGSTLYLDINAGTGMADALSFTGLTENSAEVIFNNNVVNFNLSGGILEDGLYTLAYFSAANAYSGIWSIGTGLDGYDASLIYDANSIKLQVGVVPEVSTTASLIAGLALLFAFCRRRR